MTTQRVYIGTYTTGKSQGIYQLPFDPATGSVGKLELAGETQNPSFLAIHPNNRFLYAVIETNDANAGAASFAIDNATGKLTPLNHQNGGGTSPCHLFVDQSGQNLLLANYASGSAAVLPIGEDGQLKKLSCIMQHHGHGPDPKRQEGPHAHEIVLDAANRFAFVPDLGLDKVMIYRFDKSAGKLTPNDPAAAPVAPETGPRVIAFDPSEKFAYVLGEMSATLTAFTYDAAAGSFQEFQTLSMLPDGYKGPRSGAQVVVHASGEFVYASNRGQDTLVTFSRDIQTGRLAYINDIPTGGKMPRHFMIDSSGNYIVVANQDSNSLTVFRIDLVTGHLTRVGPAVDVPKPVCVLFVW